ncbi:unnamed protein product [Rhizophagus irregularis]|nr:unnamed protein product [Rhizophagus irregularis]
MQMNWSLFRMAPNQTLASATTPGTKLDKNLHYCSFSNKCYCNKINVKEAMEYIAQAWNSVKVEAIVNN